MVAPAVSVVIPTYNYAQFASEAVSSVLAQRNAPPLEVIVVDDGSTDDTRERLRTFGDRIRYLYQENRGLPGARNTGIRHARGEWVALLDADDSFHPDKTALQLRVAQQHGFDVIGSPGMFYSSAELPPDPPVRSVDVTGVLTGTHISSSTTMVRRRCFDEVGLFDEALRSVEDRDMWLRLAARFPIGVVDSPCTQHRQHDGQMSRNADRMLENFARVLAKFFAEHPQHASSERLAYAFMYTDAAIAHMQQGARAKAIDYLVRSLRLHAWEPSTGRATLSSSRRLKLLLRTLIGEALFEALRGGGEKSGAPG